MNWLSRDEEPGWQSGSEKVRSIFASTSVSEITSVRTSAHIALIGNFAPRKCGIATFMTEIYEKLHEYHPEISVDVHALDDPTAPLDYRDVAGTIMRDDPDDYARAARQINESGVDAVWLQHEYGIFGGEDGAMVCHFVDRLAAPLILTLHTVLSEPSPHQRASTLR